MLVFTVGTAVIVAISLHNYLLGSATFVWSIKETITVFIVMLALVVWKFTNDDTGVITTTFAMVVAGVPVWIDTYHAPATQNILFWSIATGSCMLTYIGSPKKFIARFMPFCGAASNMLIILLACRKFL
jgi:hypothetical protein